MGGGGDDLKLTMTTRTGKGKEKMQAGGSGGGKGGGEEEGIGEFTLFAHFFFARGNKLFLEGQMRTRASDGGWKSALEPGGRACLSSNEKEGRDVG